MPVVTRLRARKRKLSELSISSSSDEEPSTGSKRQVAANNVNANKKTSKAKATTKTKQKGQSKTSKSNKKTKKRLSKSKPKPKSKTKATTKSKKKQMKITEMHATRRQSSPLRKKRKLGHTSQSSQHKTQSPNDHVNNSHQQQSKSKTKTKTKSKSSNNKDANRNKSESKKKSKKERKKPETSKKDGKKVSKKSKSTTKRKSARAKSTKKSNNKSDIDPSDSSLANASTVSTVSNAVSEAQDSFQTQAKPKSKAKKNKDNNSSKPARRSQRLATKDGNDANKHKNSNNSNNKHHNETMPYYGNNGQFASIGINPNHVNYQLSSELYSQLPKYLFDESCKYSLLQVFHIAYDTYSHENISFDCDQAAINCNGNGCDELDRNKLKNGLWYWLFMFSKFCIVNKRYRILILPNVKSHAVIEVRVDSLHGMPCGLLNELIANKCSFEYYYAYSRLNYWGGWRFYYTGKLIQYREYGYLHSGNGDGMKLHMPSDEWKNVVWIKQLDMELIASKFGTNMMSLMTEYQRQRDLFERDGGYANGLKFDFFDYYKSQVFDQSWWQKHYYSDGTSIQNHCVTMSYDDVLQMLGTKVRMVCAQCGQTQPICKALKLCKQFKGYFKFKDLYDRHKAMVISS